MFFNSDICMFVVAIRVENITDKKKMWSESHAVIGNVSLFLTHFETTFAWTYLSSLEVPEELGR